MVNTALGYDKDLFVLPFDHRSSFERGLLGISGRQATSQEVEELAAYKQIIYEGLLKALENGVPAETAAILVDQKYGTEILADAKERGIVTCAPVEKSGQAEFDFEQGDDFGRRLQEASPTFAKALVRYNPDGDEGVNGVQRERLRILSDFAHSSGYKFMFELLVPATEPQLESVREDSHAYDSRLRPDLTVRTIKELQEVGIDPDVWKLEGTDDPDAARRVVSQAKTGNRDNVGVIVLGRGENETRVRDWLTTGAQTEGVIGFAVGRTVFWQPLLDLKDGKTSRANAVDRIAETYQGFYRLFIDARAKAKALEGAEG